MSLSVESKQNYFVPVHAAGSSSAVSFQQNHVALHEKGESTQGGNRDRLITTWSPTGKSVELYMNEKGIYYMRVRVGQKESIVPEEDITGIALRHLKNPASLEMVQKASFVTLNPTSDQSYKVTIHARGMGGSLTGCLASIGNLTVRGIKYANKQVSRSVKSCLGLKQGKVIQAYAAVRVAQIQAAVAQIEADGRERVAQIEKDGEIAIKKEETEQVKIETDGRERVAQTLAAVAQIEADGKARVAQIEADGRERVAQIEKDREIAIKKEETEQVKIETDGRARIAQIEADGKARVAEIKKDRKIAIEKEETKRRMLEVFLELRRGRMEA